MNSLTIVKARYPKLIGCGCISHVSDLLIEDLFRVVEFKDVLNKVKFLGHICPKSSSSEESVQDTLQNAKDW